MKKNHLFNIIQWIIVLLLMVYWFAVFFISYNAGDSLRRSAGPYFSFSFLVFSIIGYAVVVREQLNQFEHESFYFRMKTFLSESWVFFILIFLTLTVFSNFHLLILPDNVRFFLIIALLSAYILINLIVRLILFRKMKNLTEIIRRNEISALKIMLNKHRLPGSLNEVSQKIYEYGNKEILNLFSENGIEIQNKDLKNTSPAALAASKGNLKMLEYLIETGENIHQIVSGKKWTPLIFAAVNGEKETVQFLVQHGADMDHEDVKGRNTEKNAKIYMQKETADYLKNLRKNQTDQ